MEPVRLNPEIWETRIVNGREQGRCRVCNDVNWRRKDSCIRHEKAQIHLDQLGRVRAQSDKETHDIQEHADALFSIFQFQDSATAPLSNISGSDSPPDLSLGSLGALSLLESLRNGNSDSQHNDTIIHLCLRYYEAEVFTFSVFDTTKQRLTFVLLTSSSTEQTRPSSRLSIVSLHDPVFVPVPSPTLSEVKFMSTLASDTTRPSVSIITLNTSLFKHDSLSKDQNHFSSWKRQFIQTLRMNQGADGYLTGRILCPSADTEPRAYSNWNANNGSILGFMGLVIDEAEQEVIDGASTAEAAWKLLVKRHAQEGPVKQVQLIQEALNVRYSPSEKYSTTSSKLTTLNKRIWDMGSLDSELFLCIIMINSMSNVPELRATRENVAQQFAQSDGTKPDLEKNPTARKYDSSDIKRALDMAQGLLPRNQAFAVRSVAFRDVRDQSVTRRIGACRPGVAWQEKLLLNREKFV
ncbi:hypothetical protein K435DRAFT_839995 [Dendrothele bispora CBS 962.96]|uniref:Uncharacterized protein n=1 Tax=Dendrothele bispora (strain CBS 962.96) TaxID=1314807 RepID=A0A4S8LWQ9_DENBC|nr:hypothetical protein K435DRAFT_839995 [Dendrothele bispora CBS 962.96]